LPHNAGHLIAIELYNGSCYFDLAHRHPLPISMSVFNVS